LAIELTPTAGLDMECRRQAATQAVANGGDTQAIPVSDSMRGVCYPHGVVKLMLTDW